MKLTKTIGCICASGDVAGVEKYGGLCHSTVLFLRRRVAKMTGVGFKVIVVLDDGLAVAGSIDG